MTQSIKSTKHGEKGQVEMYDLIAASFILLMITGTGIMLFYGQTMSLDSASKLQRMQLSAVNSFNQMLTDTNCLNGGISDGKEAVAPSKIACFNSQSYSSMQERLGIGEYDFYVRIYDDTNTYLAYGQSTAKNAVSVQRAVNLNNSAKKGLFIIYEK